MPSLPALLAPLALLLPFGLASEPAPWPISEQTAHQAQPSKAPVSALPLSDRAPGWEPLLEAARPASAQQVRIERRVILRISPATGTRRQSFVSEASEARAAPRRFVERPHGACLESGAIAAVGTRENRLLMYLRDRQIISAKLANGCSPREFYQGFYMERSEDGKLCVDRDKLLSRSGSKCEVAELHRLVRVVSQ